MANDADHQTSGTPSELGAIHERLDKGDTRMGNIEKQLSLNTDITRDIKDLLDATRLGLRVLGGIGVIAKWAGTIAAAIVALWGLVVALKSGLPPK